MRDERQRTRSRRTIRLHRCRLQLARHPHPRCRLHRRRLPGPQVPTNATPSRQRSAPTKTVRKQCRQVCDPLLHRKRRNRRLQQRVSRGLVNNLAQMAMVRPEIPWITTITHEPQPTRIEMPWEYHRCHRITRTCHEQTVLEMRVLLITSATQVWICLTDRDRLSKPIEGGQDMPRTVTFQTGLVLRDSITFTHRASLACQPRSHSRH